MGDKRKRSKSLPHVVDLVQRAICAHESMPPSSIGAQLDRLRLGIHLPRNPYSEQHRAAHRADTCTLSVLRGLTERQYAVLYAEYYWRAGWAERERRQGRVVIGYRSALRPTRAQASKALGISKGAYEQHLYRALRVCESNLAGDS